MKTTEISFDEFKARLIAKHGASRLTFREAGKFGWTSVEDILDRKPGGQTGPHWCDVSFVPGRRLLAGSYNFNTGVATFFS